MAERPTECEFIEGCPMFRYFSEVAEDIYHLCYCKGDYENCERRKLRIAGENVPVSLLPQGYRLWDEEACEPPELFIT